MRHWTGGNNKFIGVTFVMVGYFRKTLSIVRRGTLADELNACVRNSFIQQSFRSLTLKNKHVSLL